MLQTPAEISGTTLCPEPLVIESNWATSEEVGSWFFWLARITRCTDHKLGSAFNIGVIGSKELTDKGHI